MKALTVKEYGRVAVGEGKALTKGEAQRFLSLAERMRPQLNSAHVLTYEGDALRSQQVVGVLAIPGKTLEILPKVDGEDGQVRRALVHMIAVAHDLKVADAEIAALSSQRHDLLEIVIGLFVQRLTIAVRRGLPRRYVGHEEDLPVLRGRLNVVRQFTQLAVRPDILACRYDQLSEDTPLNRVLKAAVRRLAGVARSAANARRLAELAARFEFVGESAHPLREPVQRDRNSTAFYDLYKLARFLLSGDWQTTTGGKMMGFPLLFKMNVLFEKFVCNTLERTLGPRRVDLKESYRSALRDADGELFQLEPDVLIDMPDGIVLDTKWKRLEPKEEQPRKWGVREPDVYQLLAYARAYGAERIILLYPWHRDLPAAPGIMAHWWAPGLKGERIQFDIATVDVGNPKAVPAMLCAIVRQRPRLKSASQGLTAAGQPSAGLREEKGARQPLPEGTAEGRHRLGGGYSGRSEFRSHPYAPEN